MPPRSRPAVPTHAEALAVALSTLALGAVDDAAKRLAVGYAQAIDADPAALVKIGHMYLATLAALGLTPAARRAVVAGEVADDGRRPGDQLGKYRQRRQARGEA